MKLPSNPALHADHPVCYIYLQEPSKYVPCCSNRPKKKTKKNYFLKDALQRPTSRFSFLNWTQYTSEYKFAVNNLFLFPKVRLCQQLLCTAAEIICGLQIENQRTWNPRTCIQKKRLCANHKSLKNTDREQMFNNSGLGLINTFTSYFRNVWMTVRLPTYSFSCRIYDVYTSIVE